MRRNNKRLFSKVTMIVCSCYGISENDYRKALRSGVSRRDPKLHAEQSPEACESCPAGRGCGSCLQTLLNLAENEAAGRKSQLVGPIARQS